MSTDEEVRDQCLLDLNRADNGVVINILFEDLVKRKYRSDEPQKISLPYRKAMKQIAKMTVVVNNEVKALAVPEVGPRLAKVIKKGLLRAALYKRPSEVADRRITQKAVKKQKDEKQAEKMKNKKPRIRVRGYRPRKGSGCAAICLLCLG